MNYTLYTLLEQLESLTPAQIQSMTLEQRKTLAELTFQITMKLIRQIESGMTINEKDDHFWTDLGKTFLGI